MRLILAYKHCYPSYLGGLLRRAAKRLRLPVVTIGPVQGQWIHDTPEEEGWRPDVEVPDQPGQYFETRSGDVIINVDQGDGFYALPTNKVPVAWCFTEGNPSEYDKAIGRADVIWSCMPRKPAGMQLPGLHHLSWSYDSEFTPLYPIQHEHRVVDVSLRGSWGSHRQRFVDAFTSDISYDCGAPLSRAAWGKSLQNACITIADHEPGYLSGRIIDAMASGCLVFALRSDEMDILSPKGYVVLSGKKNSDIDPQEIVAKIHEYRDIEKRGPIAERAQRHVAGLDYESQLLRILGSVGIHV